MFVSVRSVAQGGIVVRAVKMGRRLANDDCVANQFNAQAVNEHGGRKPHALNQRAGSVGVTSSADTQLGGDIRDLFRRLKMREVSRRL
jgi:hypothetical protein